MSKRKVISLVTFLVPPVILVLLIPLNTARSAYIEGGNEVVFTIPVNVEGGALYAGENVPDMARWGPAAFSVAQDGTFWIADTVGNRLLHYGPDGGLLDLVKLDDYGVVGIGDIDATGADIVVLDIAAIVPRVLRLATNGKLVANYEIPEGLRVENGLSGIALGDHNEILLEREGGALLSQLVNAKGALEPMPLPGYIHQERVYKAQPADLGAEDTTRGYITAGASQIEVVVSNTLAGLRILGFKTDGSFYVVVEEMVTDPTIWVDQTVRLYSSMGEQLGLARVPIAEQYTYVAHGLTVGPDGSIYALLTHADRLDVVRLGFSRVLEPILSPQAAVAKVQNTDLQDASAINPQTCRDRSAMLTTASGYTGNSKYLNATNTDGACTGRGKPRYIGGAGTYASVAYDWGGWDTVSGYNGYMDPNTYKAGDIDTVNPTGSGGVESCSRGVDCSGFVSRVWALASKHSTCMLEYPDVSCTLLATTYLRRGDILNTCTGGHVVWFDTTASGGVYAYESTTYNSYDRVVRMYSSWTRLAGYTPRRYCNVCGTDTCGISGVSTPCAYR